MYIAFKMDAFDILDACLLPELLNIVTGYAADEKDLGSIIDDIATSIDPFVAYMTAYDLFELRKVHKTVVLTRLAQTGLFCRGLFDRLGVMLRSKEDVDALVVPYVRIDNLTAVKYLMFGAPFLVPIVKACFRYNALNVLQYMLTKLYAIETFKGWGMLHLTHECDTPSFEALSIALRIGIVSLSDATSMQEAINSRFGITQNRLQVYTEFLQAYGSKF
jgi:hypothetical protein